MQTIVILTLVIILGNTRTDFSHSQCKSDCCRTLPDRQPQLFTFYQDTGRFIGGQGSSSIQTMGYSGHDEGYLNPDKQCAPGDIGPLPASTYKIGYCKNVMHETTQRPCSFYLDPQHPQQLCGRQDFFVHGCQCCSSQDDSQPPVLGCSAGCIVINYDNRRKLRIGDTIIVKHHDPHNLELLIN